VDFRSIDESFMIPESTGIIISSGLIPFALVTLITYMMFKSLRTLPGVILMNLELAYILFHITLIIFQAIQLSEDDPGATCVVNNATGFYTLAAIGTWKNIFLQHTCWVFYKASKLQSATRDKIAKTVVVYSLIGWGSPLLISAVIFSVGFIDRREFLYDTEECINILNESASGVGKLLAF